MRSNDEQKDLFVARLSYIPQGEGADGLAKAVHDAEERNGGPCAKLHYLSVPPSAAPAVIKTIRDAGLVPTPGS